MGARSDGKMQPLRSSLRPAPTASRGLQAPATSSLPKKAASSQRPLPPPSCSAVSLPPSRRPLLCLSRWLILFLPPQHGCSSQGHRALSLSSFSTPPSGSLEPSPNAPTSSASSPPPPPRPSPVSGAPDNQYRLPPGHLWEHPIGPHTPEYSHPTYLSSLSKASANFKSPV